MKKNLIYLNVIALAIVTFLFSVRCSRDDNDRSKPVGTLELSVGLSVVAQNVYNDLKASLADFVVYIYNEAGEEVESFPSAADLPVSIELEEGNYYVAAHTDNNLPAAFDNPYYYGSSPVFTISGGTTTPVSFTCTLANIMVSVVYSGNVISGFSDYSTTVRNSTDSLVFGANESRAGYFSDGPLHIVSNLYYDHNGTTEMVVLTGEIPDPQPQMHYEIHIDASVGTGASSIELLIDESCSTEIVDINNATVPEGEAEPGDLLITEIMYNPDAVSDSEGEWFEVYNNSAKTLNLIDLVIRRGSNNDRHQIGSDLILSPSQYVVLAINDLATDNVDYVYGSAISLTNTGYELFINRYGTDGTDGEVICSVDYSAENFNTGLSGCSLQLDPSVTTVEEARNGLNWCASTSAYNTGDFGTPGLINTTCN